MPSEPRLFDDEPTGGAISDGVESSNRRADGDSGTPRTPFSHDRSRGPNYLFRRAVVVGGIVAVLATASVVIGRLIGSGGEETVSGAVGTDWNRIVLVDTRSGLVIVDDGAGDEQSRIESKLRSPTDAAVVETTAVVAATDRLAVIDLIEESVEAYEFGADSIVAPVGSALTMVAQQPDGTRALLVHGPSGDVIDTDSFTPVVGARYDFPTARSTRSGRDVLVTDSGNFQSVLFSFDRDEPSFFPGLALAVDDGIVVTAQNVGNEATVNVFDHDGKPIATGRTPSVRAAMIAGPAVILVTADGQVLSMAASSGDTTDSGTLAVGTVVTGGVVAGLERLVVSGTTGIAVIDETVEALDVYEGQQLADTADALHTSMCVPLRGIEADAASSTAVVDVTGGDVVVEAVAAGPLVVDATGCVVATPTETGFDVLSVEGVRRFDDGGLLVALSPDGQHVIVEREGRLRLVPLDSAAGESVDLGPRGRLVLFTHA